MMGGTSWFKRAHRSWLKIEPTKDSHLRLMSYNLLHQKFALP